MTCVRTSMCSTCFPRSSLPADASLSSTGSSGASSPASTVLSKRYDFLPPIPPHFVSFAWRYLGCTRCVRSLADECAAEAWSWSPGISGREFAEETSRISQVPGEPQLSVCTCSRPTPAGLLAPDHTVQQRGPWSSNRQRLPRIGLSTLNSMAFGLAVYASQCGLPQHHARLASSRWSGATGRASHPQGSDERFQSCFLHLIPLSQALLGAIACHLEQFRTATELTPGRSRPPSLFALSSQWYACRIETMRPSPQI